MSNETIKLHQHHEICESGCHEERHHESEHHHEYQPITVTIHDASIVGSYKFK